MSILASWQISIRERRIWTSFFTIIFEQKSTYPALEIAYLAVDRKFQDLHIGSALTEQIVSMAQEQKLGGCVFLTVRAWHISEYSAVGFYEKNQFAKLTPIPQMDVWPMYKTVWPEEMN